MARLLPLFPLDVVLFPGMSLPLHIFEPRYREMMGECIEGKSPFGVLHTVKDGVAEVGCTAHIVQIVKRYDDGRLDILSEGVRRFELVELNQERTFLRGEVAFFDDEVQTAPVERRKQALDLHRRLIGLAGSVEDLPSPEEPRISFALATTLPVDLEFKQALLALRSEPDRLDLLIEYYEKVIPKLQRAVHVREKAGGNGHGLH